MIRSVADWLSRWVHRGARKPLRTRGPSRRAVEVELLEERTLLSAVTLSGDPQTIPLPSLPAGQNALLRVDFSTSDAQGELAHGEKEPVVIETAAGRSITIAN